MKRQLLFLSATAILWATACQNDDQPATASDYKQSEQAIINGSPAPNEPAVVSLFLPQWGECPVNMQNKANQYCSKTYAHYPMCMLSIENQINADNYRCVAECKKAGEIIHFCTDSSDQTSGLSYEQEWECLDFSGYLAPIYNPHIHICNHACNSDGKTCDAQGYHNYNPCNDEQIQYCRNNYGNDILCASYLEGSYCAPSCSKEGESSISCQTDDFGDYRYKTVCTKVGDQLINLIDYDDSYYCASSCNSNKTDCDSKGKYKRPQNHISGMSFCTGTLIHPQ